MKKTMIFILVFISGSAVLAIEILGTRILGPFYGVTLYLWSALITVTLAALSIGYFVGGHQADKNAKISSINWLLIGAAAWLYAIPFLKVPLLRLGHIMGIRIAVLVAALGLFTVPLTLLGMVSPYAIRVRARHLGEVGRSAGKLYAVSTIGSVFAALAVGFFLIPFVGVTRLVLFTGVYLLLGAGFGFIMGDKSIQQGVAIVVLSIVGIFLLATSGEKAAPSQGLLTVRQSNYGEIRVLDTPDGLRYLLIDGCMHSVVDKDSSYSVCSYAAVYDVIRYFYKNPGRLLLIGLGAGSVAKNYALENWTVDTVEIDPVITEVARKYFGLRESESAVFHADGRQFLSDGTVRYDVILVDAYNSTSIPFHLITVEAFAEMEKRLENDGILAMNIIDFDRDASLIISACATVGKLFENVLVLPIPSEDFRDKLTSFIVLASNKEFALEREFPERPLSNSQTRVMLKAWNRRYIPDTDRGTVITDDLNPVDLWSEAINLEDRKFLIAVFGFKGLNW